jgi:Zn-dependent protease with chaperone function
MAHIVATDPDIGRYACAYRGHTSGLPYIVVGGDLADGDRDAVIAHELAHHQLGHTIDPTPQRFTAAAWAAVGAGAAAVFAHPAATLLLAVGAVIAYLTARALDRAQEIEADLAAGEALNSAGADGRALTLAVLAAGPADPWWIRCGGWVASGHPTLRTRMARVARSLEVAADLNAVR